MRDIYKRGDFDLTGTAVGVVERGGMLGAERVREGSAVIGLRSSGVHANGFSLVRRALADLPEAQWMEAGEGGSLAERLLAPTVCYANALRAVLESPLGQAVEAAAHISGGGLVDNLPRVLPEGLGAVLDRAKLRMLAGPVAGLFDIIREHAASAGLDISEAEMYRVFNMGTGFILITKPEATQGITAQLSHLGVAASQIGSVGASAAPIAWA
jgi:phosphoribosylformylglycinamidine cyclo-ligase